MTPNIGPKKLTEFVKYSLPNKLKNIKHLLVASIFKDVREN